MTLAARLAYTCARMQPTDDLILNYAKQADELEQLVTAFSGELVITRPEKSRWSILEIVCHLTDAELMASVRIRRIITQDRPKLWGYKQDVWADQLSYRQNKIKRVLRQFGVLRRQNSELLKHLDHESWQQTGLHDDYGELSLQKLIEDYLSHTARHLSQIKSVAAENWHVNQRMKGISMTKTQEKKSQLKDLAESKDGDIKNKKDKLTRDKNGKELVGRVKKVVKKSRRKLGEEKFEKELQRTIAFLEELQNRIADAENGQSKNNSKKKDKTGKKNARNAKSRKPAKKEKANRAKAVPEVASVPEPETSTITD